MERESNIQKNADKKEHDEKFEPTVKDPFFQKKIFVIQKRSYAIFKMIRLTSQNMTYWSWTNRISMRRTETMILPHNVAVIGGDSVFCKMVSEE